MIYYQQRKNNILTANFSKRILEAWRQQNNVSHVLLVGGCQSRLVYQAKLFKCEGNIKISGKKAWVRIQAPQIFSCDLKQIM